MDIVFKDHEGTVSQYDPRLPKKIADRVADARSKWFGTPLFMLIASLFVNGVSAAYIDALLECCRQLSHDADCIDKLRRAPTLSELMIIIVEQAADNPLYTSKVSSGDFDAIKRRNPGTTDGNRLDGDEFMVSWSDPITHFAKKFASKREVKYQKFINMKRSRKDDFYKKIDPQTASSGWDKTIAAQIPFFKMRGLYIPHRNDVHPSLPHVFVPGIVVSHTPKTQQQTDNDDVTITTANQQSPHPSQSTGNGTKFMFVTFVKQHFLNLSKQDIEKNIVNDVTIDLHNSNMTSDSFEWKCIEEVGPSVFNHPRLYGIRLYPVNNSNCDKLYIKLMDNGTLEYDEWDIVALSKNHSWQSYHTSLHGIHSTKVTIFEGYDDYCPSIEISHFKTVDNQCISLLQAFPDIVHIKDLLRFFARPDLYPYPKGIEAIWCNDFVDGIQTQHSSALAPGITMIQTRQLNGDMSDIINTGMTFSHRGLSPILAGHSRLYLALSTIGRTIQRYDLEQDKLMLGYAFGGLGMLSMDRMELTNVTHKSAHNSVNPGPKRIGLFEDRMPYEHWKNPDWNYSVDFFKSQRLINATVKFINTYCSQLTSALQNKIVSAVGASEQVLHQPPSRMPGLATCDLCNAEPSQLILSGMLQPVLKFMIQMIERDNPIRMRILTIAYKHTFQQIRQCHSHNDFVSINSGKFAKSAWKFNRNYHLCLKLLCCINMFASSFESNFIDLIKSVNNLLHFISLLWGPTFGNHLRVQTEKLLDEFMRTWRHSDCDPNILYDSNGKPSKIVATKKAKSKTNTNTKKNKSSHILTDINELQQFINHNKDKQTQLAADDIVSWSVALAKSKLANELKSKPKKINSEEDPS